MLTLLTAFVVLTAGDDSIVHLKNGKSIVCEVSERKGDAIEILVEGKKRRIPRAQIDRITDQEGNIRWIDALVTSTAHYEIHSNVPRERAKELGRKLEMLYAWFFQTYGKDWRLHDVKRLTVPARERDASTKSTWPASRRCDRRQWPSTRPATRRSVSAISRYPEGAPRKRCSTRRGTSS
jgi:phosphopantetheine adenylyltransferase